MNADPFRDIRAELARIDGRWREERGDEFYASAHELLGVLMEEFDEFKDSVYQDLPSYVELMQVAAVAIRGMEWLARSDPSLVAGMLKSYEARRRHA